MVVRDYGVGIAPEDLSRIFDRFERAKRRSSPGGFGVGLWVVKTLCDASADGAGKTLLANQICFHSARSGERWNPPCQEIVRKPFTPQRLFELVDNYLPQK
jgi:hypothetical protein